MADGNGGGTVWAYDTHDRKVSETYQDNSKRTYAFDSADDVVTYTDENEVLFQHDGHNETEWCAVTAVDGLPVVVPTLEEVQRR